MCRVDCQPPNSILSTGPFGISYFLIIIGEGHFIRFPVSSFCSFVKNLSCSEQTVYNQDVGVVLIVLDM